MFSAEKKLFNSAQVAQTKIPRNEAKICQETDFLSSEGHLLTFPGCCLTLVSSLDVVQVRFAPEAFTAFCWETAFLISQLFRFVRKSIMLALFVFKSKM